MYHVNTMGQRLYSVACVCGCATQDGSGEAWECIAVTQAPNLGLILCHLCAPRVTRKHLLKTFSIYMALISNTTWLPQHRRIIIYLFLTSKYLHSRHVKADAFIFPSDCLAHLNVSDANHFFGKVTRCVNHVMYACVSME